MLPEQSLLRLVGFEHLHLNLTSEESKIDESLREIVGKSNSDMLMKKRAKALERRIEANFGMIRTSSRSALVAQMADPAYLDYVSSLQVIISIHQGGYGKNIVFRDRLFSSKIVFLKNQFVKNHFRQKSFSLTIVFLKNQFRQKSLS